MRKEILAVAAAASLVGSTAVAQQHAHTKSVNRGSQGAFLASARAEVKRKTSNIVTVKTMDYAFQAPDTIAAGVVSFRIENAGKELHHVWLVKLEQGKTAADYLEAMKGWKPGQPFPSWAIDVGGPNASVPGVFAEGTLNLEPGRYLLLCHIPSPDGVPHSAKGMFKPISVVAKGGIAQAGAASASAPDADLTITLTDYDFVPSKAIAAGRRTIRFVNDAAQPHEAFIAKLAPGKTMQEAFAFLEKQQGPPPITPKGGITGIAKGRAIDFTADFEPGEYLFVCFVPDAKDGKPHVMHGMGKVISVK
jgi:plastocyanin